jgi:hypothetical protein
VEIYHERPLVAVQLNRVRKEIQKARLGFLVEVFVTHHEEIPSPVIYDRP